MRSGASPDFRGARAAASQHPDIADCIVDTARNNAFVAKHSRMPPEPVAAGSAT